MTLPPPIRAKIHAMRNPADYDAPKARLDAIRAWLAARGYHLSLDEIGAIIRDEGHRQQALAMERRLAAIPGMTPDDIARYMALSPIDSIVLMSRMFLEQYRLRQTSRQQEAAALAAQLAQARQTIAELSSTLSILAAKL